MDLTDILESCAPGILPVRGRRSVRLVRHASSRWEMARLFAEGFLEIYQAQQTREVFDGCTYIVSFLGERGTRSRLVGVYEVRGVKETVRPWPRGYPYPQMDPGHYVYKLARVSDFGELENRLVVDWGSGTRSWVQWLTPKKVIELRPVGYVREFPGYDNVLLGFSELVQIIENPEANRDWHIALSQTAGIYLIADSSTGNQYVGSACGERGILGRWRAYAKTGHGGNQQLKGLLSKNDKRCLDFNFSILRTLPTSMTPREVIAVESLYKNKLGTRAYGLNSN